MLTVCHVMCAFDSVFTKLILQLAMIVSDFNTKMHCWHSTPMQRINALHFAKILFFSNVKHTCTAPVVVWQRCPVSSSVRGVSYKNVCLAPNFNVKIQLKMSNTEKGLTLQLVPPVQLLCLLYKHLSEFYWTKNMNIILKQLILTSLYEPWLLQSFYWRKQRIVVRNEYTSWKYDLAL